MAVEEWEEDWKVWETHERVVRVVAGLGDEDYGSGAAAVVLESWFRRSLIIAIVFQYMGGACDSQLDTYCTVPFHAEA